MICMDPIISYTAPIRFPMHFSQQLSPFLLLLCCMFFWMASLSFKSHDFSIQILLFSEASFLPCSPPTVERSYCCSGLSRKSLCLPFIQTSRFYYWYLYKLDKSSSCCSFQECSSNQEANLQIEILTLFCL